MDAMRFQKRQNSPRYTEIQKICSGRKVTRGLGSTTTATTKVTPQWKKQYTIDSNLWDSCHSGFLVTLQQVMKTDCRIHKAIQNNCEETNSTEQSKKYQLEKCFIVCFT